LIFQVIGFRETDRVIGFRDDHMFAAHGVAKAFGDFFVEGFAADAATCSKRRRCGRRGLGAIRRYGRFFCTRARRQALVL
jgi:hypothetical protein